MERHLGLQLSPLQPVLHHVQKMLATSGGVADDASIISIEKVVDGDGGLQESETKILPGAEGVRESVHNCQKDDHIERVSLIHPYLKRDRIYRPRIC